MKDVTKMSERELRAEVTELRRKCEMFARNSGRSAENNLSLIRYLETVETQLQGIKEAYDELAAAPSYANWQEKHKLHSLLGMIK